MTSSLKEASGALNWRNNGEGVVPQGTHTAPYRWDPAWEGRSAGEVREELGARMSRDCVLQVVTNNRSIVH